MTNKTIARPRVYMTQARRFELLRSAHEDFVRKFGRAPTREELSLVAGVPKATLDACLARSLGTEHPWQLPLAETNPLKVRKRRQVRRDASSVSEEVLVAAVAALERIASALEMVGKEAAE